MLTLFMRHCIKIICDIARSVPTKLIYVVAASNYEKPYLFMENIAMKIFTSISNFSSFLRKNNYIQKKAHDI